MLKPLTQMVKQGLSYHALTGTLRPWLPRLKRSTMGHKVTEEQSAIAAHAGVVSVLY